MCCFAVLVLPFLFRVLIMKLLKSSIEYALQNSVSNPWRLFWWKSLIGTALLWFSRASYIVQVSILKLFESFGWLHLQMWCWFFSLVLIDVSYKQSAALLFSCFLFWIQISVMKMFKFSIECALQNSVSNHSRLFWWETLIGIAMLWFSLVYTLFKSHCRDSLII